MPIQLNLLAETQALEDLRRRDPVKRTIWLGVMLVLLLLAWSSSLQLKAMIARGELSRLEARLHNQTNSYGQVLEAQKRLRDANLRLESLQRLSTNRLLYGNMLNAIQHSTVDAIQLIRLKTDQTYILNDEIKPKTNANNHIVPGKPATITERIVITLDAKDTATSPGDQIPTFRRAISENPYFMVMLGKTNDVRLTSLSPPSVRDSKPSVLFTLECRLPEVTR